MIDLVADEHEVARLRHAADGLELRWRDHGTGGVGGAGDQHPVELATGGCLLKGGRGELIACLRIGADRHRFEIERLQDVAVGRIGGHGERDAGACVKRREERELETAGAAGGNDHLAGGHIHPVGFFIMAGDAGAQGWKAERFGIAELVGRQRVGCGFAHQRGRGRAGLPHLHVDDFVALRFALIGGAHDIHDDEGGDLPPLRAFHGPVSCPAGSRARRGPRRSDPRRRRRPRCHAGPRPGRPPHSPCPVRQRPWPPAPP